MAKAVKSDKNTDQNYVDSDLSYLPAVTYPDIVNYLLFTPSPYTATDLKCYKGLEAYNQIVCGWVRDVVSKKVERRCLVKAKVLHSQNLSEKPLQPWVVAEMDGRILSCHCNCVAGLGETCTLSRTITVLCLPPMPPRWPPSVQ